MLQVRPQRAQHRGAEQDAAQQHAHDRRLANAVHGLAEQPPDHHQHDELGEKDDLGRPLRALGGKRIGHGEDAECSAKRIEPQTPKQHAIVGCGRVAGRCWGAHHRSRKDQRISHATILLGLVPESALTHRNGILWGSIIVTASSLFYL